MSEKDKNIFNNKNISHFSTSITEAVKNSIENFWEQDVKVYLQAINDFREFRDEILTKKIDFFSSQIKVDRHRPVLIRLSKNFINNFLDLSLNESENAFSLRTMTQLEIKILNSFCDFLYKKINQILISPNDAKLSEESDKKINILFLLSLKNSKTSQIMISIPKDRVKLEKIQPKTSFKDEDFLNSETIVRINAGSTKLTLDELQSLTTEDIVLLEKSDSSKLTLISGELKKKFNVKVDPSMVINIDEDDKSNIESANNEVTMEKNLWDDIQIEINAEFEKVKMTIGELKQITQGQIVDLGSVFDGEISLFVEDKKVAKGELIIINDRYAVKLNEVLSSNAKQATAIPQNQPKPQPQKPQAQPQKPQPKPQAQGRPQPRPQPKPQPQKPQAQPQPKPVENEEFDYSDFEK